MSFFYYCIYFHSFFLLLLSFILIISFIFKIVKNFYKSLKLNC
uniref:Uncharacterized protein n=1 Tax=Siphoviridae sp. ctHip2 TaxID=2827830 RepID=A0A8S5RVY4_9CAUD|nr:MAG TPA: hypothetical protein [Siphoviridae sp. ctHip2]